MKQFHTKMDIYFQLIVHLMVGIWHSVLWDAGIPCWSAWVQFLTVLPIPANAEARRQLKYAGPAINKGDWAGIWVPDYGLAHPQALWVSGGVIYTSTYILK